MASLEEPPPSTLQAIDEEITFLNVLMDTLDEDASDYAERRAEYEAKKSHYQNLYQQMMIINSTPGRKPPARNMHPFGSDGAGDGRDNWWRDAMDGRPSSNHSSASAVSGTSHMSGSPYETPVPGSKRLRPQSSYLNHEHAAKRPNPNPSQVGTPTNSDSSNEYMDHNSLEQARRRHMAAEDAARRQHEMQLSDAAFARQLSQQTDYHRPTSGFRSAGRPSVQTTLNHNGSFHRPPPTVKAEPSPSISSRTDAQIPNPHLHPPPHMSAPRIKSEPGSQYSPSLAMRPRQTTQVVDLTGSDSEDDVTEVAPASFTSNQRQSFPGMNGFGFNSARSMHTPWATTMQMPTTMQQMPGSFPSSHQYNDRQVYGNPAASSSSNPWFAHAMNGVRNAASSLAAPMQQLSDLVYGSSSRPLDIDSDDDDELFYVGHRRALGNYAGNEDLYNTRYEQFAAYDSTKTKEEIQALLENIRPDEDMPAHLRVQSPADLSCRLHKYQEMGLTWLKKCEEGSNKGGILADDMGLGKTIQMLALIVSHKSEDPRCKTTLIVAPVALMRQWAQEIRSKVKPGRSQLTVFTHHGSKKAKDFGELRTYDVVLTTYGSISSELKKKEKFAKRQLENPAARPNASEKCVFLDENAEWYRVILDEAQCIKNRNTQSAKGACRLKAKYRFCVTGTPMMNNVEEFYSLIHFLQIRPYCIWEKFRLDINMPLRSAHEDTKSKAMQMLQALCKAVMLRRTKKSHFEGQPILILPERSTTVDSPVFSEDEQDFYQALETQTQIQFNKYLKKGTIGTSYSAILVLLLRLRQACCHPHLIKDFGVAAAANLEEDQLLDFARQLAEPVVARIKETGGNFECPVCYDVTPNPAIFIPCGHDTCSECLARIADTAHNAHNGDEGAAVRCPNCRGQIDPKRLTDFNSFKKVHMPELLTEAERQAEEEGQDVGSDDDSSSESEAEEGEEDEDETLDGFIVPDGIDEEPEAEESDDDDLDRPFRARKEVKAEGVAGPSGAAQADVNNEAEDKNDQDRVKSSKKKKKKGKAKNKAKKPKSTQTLADLKKMASRNKSAKKAYLRRLRKTYISSAKIEKTMEILDDIMARAEGEKVLIFSQWTSLLDLLEIPIDEKGYGYRRYDGSMTANMRGDAVDDFRDDRKDVRIMLISLKAGNAGLNLNMASQVIILDPFWNPYIEEQAIDRAHRFGQTREVRVHRVLIADTVEDRILALQEKKRALIAEALDEKSGQALSRLGVQELAYLFGVTHDPAQRVSYTACGGGGGH